MKITKEGVIFSESSITEGNKTIIEREYLLWGDVVLPFAVIIAVHVVCLLGVLLLR